MARMKILISLLLLVWLAWPLGICEASPPVAAAKLEEAARDENFTRGYELFGKQKYAASSARLYQFLQEHSADEEDYEWARFFLGIGLNELGFSHAAVDNLSHLVTRKPNAKIVAYSLEVLEQIARTRPFDWEQVILDVLCGQDYGFVDARLQNFIHYYQGIYDWEHGYHDWGTEHLEEIEPGSFYFFKYLYQKALYQLDQNRLQESTALLEELLSAPDAPEELKDEARITLARILYEQEQFETAYQVYQELKKPSVQQARYLLERAWNQYRLGNPEKAMGLLYAFEAPLFWRHFTPEYFILKSFIYKDVCHYRQALAVVEEFKDRYQRSLEAIYRRRDIAENRSLLLVMMEKRKIKRLYEFLETLEAERTTIARVPDEGLRQHLAKIYRLQIEQTSTQLKELVESEYERLASDLLRYEEEAHLLEYEIGLDMYQRASDYHYDGKQQTVDGEPKKSVVVFPFQGEFWNDELKDYQVKLENKCESLEEWDIFFQ